MTRLQSITVRLTLLFGAASAAVLLALGYVIHAAVAEHFAAQDRSDLMSKLDLAEHILARVRTPPELDNVPQQLDDALIGHHDLAIAIVRSNGEMLFASSGAPFPAPVLRGTIPTPGQAPILHTWNAQGHAYRGLSALVPVGVPGEAPATVALAVSIDHHLAFMHEFQRTLWIAIAASALLTALLGWIAARRGLGPVRAMAEVTNRISPTRLTDRIAVERLPLELVDLGVAFNAMLGRLEDAFRRLSEFSSDLAHELRTPISTLMTQTQVAVSRARSAEEYREILYANLEEFNRLARIIGDMLFLAKADNGLMVPRNERVDLGDETRQLFEFYEALAEEQGIELAVSGEGTIVGDRLMIRRGIANLLSNALRHSDRGAAVRVAIEGIPPGRVRWSIENRGPSIPPHHLQRIFDRFYRVDPARSHSTEGAGLGLAITKSIVEAHEGVIEVTSAHGVTRFVLTFPAAPPADDAELPPDTPAPVAATR